MKNYEMTNHLGNVQATVLDKYTPRIKHVSDTAYTLWGSNISTATDYYAFGSPMPGRATQDTVTQSFVATTPFSTTSAIVIDSVEGNTSHFAWTAFGPTSNIGFITTPTTQITNNLGCPANPVSFMNPYGVRLQVNNLQPSKSYKLYVKYKATFAEQFKLEKITPNPPFYPIVLQTANTNASGAVLMLQFTASAATNYFHLVNRTQCNYVTIDSVMLVSDTTVVGYVTNVMSEKSQKDDYRFSVNGQHKENEIAGYGNHNSALFWEYSTQLGRRWNLDPVDQVSISNYAVMGNSPILMSDPKGDLFGIKGFGSTSAQRKAAKTFASEHNGKVNGLFKKSINVTYDKLEKQPLKSYDDPNVAYGIKYDIVEKKQHFNQDGSLHDDRPAITQYIPTLFDKWSEDKSFIGSATYDLANGIYQVPQLFTHNFNGGFYNLEGSQAVRGSKEHLGSFINGATVFVPVGEAKIGVGYLQKVNAAQFSKFFKGTTVAGASPSIRGTMNKAFNNIIIKTWNDYIPTGAFLNDAAGSIPPVSDTEK